jgi:hypothetical protein
MQNLAFTLNQLGMFLDALTLLKKCTDLRNQVLGSHHPHAISSTKALRAWETAPSQSSESQEPRVLLDNPPPKPTLEHVSDNDHIALASKPAGWKRRVFTNFFRRQ